MGEIYLSMIYRCLAISSEIKKIEKDPTVRSLVLASSLPTVFSAGLDIMEMVCDR